MGRVLRTPAAKLDILDIAEFIAGHSVSAGDKLLERFDRELELLSDFPGMGQRRDDLRPGLRSFPVGNYLLFYRQIEGGIELLHVFHGARDYEKLFRDSP